MATRMGSVHRLPSSSSEAGQFDPSVYPWEKQPDETDTAYAAFRAFRDSEDRRVGEGMNQKWSSRWSWGWRTYQWDLHVAREADKEMVRYRTTMNERHRDIASAAVGKIAQWLINVDPKVLKPSEAAKWFEIAVRVQREAAGAHLSEAELGLPFDGPEPVETEQRTLAEVLGLEGMDDDAVALALYKAAGQAAK